MATRSAFFPLAVASLLAAGCGGQPERPVEQLTRAQTLIDQSEKTGAQRYAAVELERARSKLAAASAASAEGDQATASQLATEAALDAELASALAAAGQAQKAAQELEAGLETLREEATRQPDGGGADRP
ncbi:MAG: DUF4398 domain-containing protein [Steroidobacteraceae bacterium]